MTAPIRTSALIQRDSVSGATVVLDSGANFTAGSCAVFVVSYYSTAGGIVSATIGGAAAEKIIDSGGGSNYIAILFCDSVAGGTPNIELTFADSTSRYFSGSVTEWAAGVLELDTGAKGSNADTTTNAQPNAATAIATSTADSILFSVMGVSFSTSNAGVTGPTGWTDTFVEQNSSAHQGGKGAWVQSSGIGTKTALFNMTAAGGWRAAIAAFKVVGGGGTAPTITDAGDESFRVGETGISITGTNFGAEQGTGLVRICPSDDVDDVNGVEMTVTAWANTGIQFDVPASLDGAFPRNTDAYLFVRNDAGTANAAGRVVRITPPPSVLAYILLN